MLTQLLDAGALLAGSSKSTTAPQSLNLQNVIKERLDGAKNVLVADEIPADLNFESDNLERETALLALWILEKVQRSVTSGDGTDYSLFDNGEDWVLRCRCL